MSNHSLEHVADPLAALRAARSKLVPDGVLLVRLPLADSYADRHYGPDWVQLDPPRHVWIPSERGMRNLAGRAGFTVERVFFDSGSFQLYGSEFYQRDIPLNDVPTADLDKLAASSELAQRARDLNARRIGDQAGFVLRAQKASDGSSRTGCRFRGCGR